MYSGLKGKFLSGLMYAYRGIYVKSDLFRRDMGQRKMPWGNVKSCDQFHLKVMFSEVLA